MNFENNISFIENKIGYVFKDKSLLRQAFTRTSFCNEHKGKRGLCYQSNEVLEFFGDSILSAAIVTLLMKDFAKRYEYGISTALGEGDFSNIKSKLSDKKNLSLATERLGLQKFLLMGEGDAKLGVANEPSVMEDLFESIIGAIYIDSQNDVSAVIHSVSVMLNVKSYLEEKPTATQSAKNTLQEWCADKKRRLPAPIYKTVGESGPDHKKVYERACFIGDKIYGKGVGKNQKIADAQAAEAALKALMAEEDSKKTENVPDNSDTALTFLREHAKKNKKPSAEFRDLGESERSTQKAREYAVECRYDGICATGYSSDKRSAKIAAAEKIAKMIEKKEKPVKKAKKAKSDTKNTKK